MISLFGRGKIVAAVLSLIATIGWAIQGLGNAFYYRSVRAIYLSRVLGFNTDMRLTRCLTQIWQHHKTAGHSMEKVSYCFVYGPCIVSLKTSQAKAEFATHGAKAYFSRG
jgi:hypothetical protein